MVFCGVAFHHTQQSDPTDSDQSTILMCRGMRYATHAHNYWRKIMNAHTPFGRVTGQVAALAIAALCVSNADAQVFDQTIDTAPLPQIAYSVDETLNAGYITAGSIGTTGQRDIQVINYDPLGNIIWEFRYDVLGADDVAYSVVQSLSGDFIVAGHTNAGTLEGIFAKEVFVLRLDPLGNVVWFYLYDGTRGTDPIHNPDPGPSVIECLAGPSPGEIAFIANLNGLPLYTRLTSSGGLLSGAAYATPAGAPFFEPAFTDLKEFPDATIGISGSIRTLNPEGGPGFPVRPIFQRNDPSGFVILGLAAYQLFPPLCIPGDATYDDGRGLDVRPADNFVYLAGKTDLGGEGIDVITGATVPNATHLILIDPFQPVPPPLIANAYDPNFNGCQPDTNTLTPAYATVRADKANAEAIIGLTYTSLQLLPPPVNSASALLVTDPILNPRFLFHYLVDTANESVARHASTCGYSLAGAAFIPGPIVPAPSDDIHLLNTDDFGATFCTEQPPPFLTRPIQPIPIPIEFIVNQITPEVFFPISVTPTNSTLNIICKTPFCFQTGACCFACTTPGSPPTPCIDTTAANCAALSGCFRGIGTSCATPGICRCPGDVNCDGTTNLADFNILAVNFGAGPGATRAQGDLNCDGFVNLADFNVLAVDFGCT